MTEYACMYIIVEISWISVFVIGRESLHLWKSNVLSDSSSSVIATLTPRESTF